MCWKWMLSRATSLQCLIHCRKKKPTSPRGIWLCVAAVMQLCMLTNVIMTCSWANQRPPYTLYHSFHLPELRFDDARHHIHMLERLQTARFEIKNTSSPSRLGDYVCVGAECLIMGKRQFIRMYTSSVLESTVMCLNEQGEQAATYQLQLYPDRLGCVVSLNTTIYKTPRWIYQISESLFSFMLMYKSAPCTYDRNLILYRRMVLGS